MDDVVFSTKKWEKIYKENNDRQDYKSDLTVISYKKFLDKYKKYYKTGVFLDLGCGIAFASALLAREGIDVTGIDVSRTAIAKSEKLFKKEKLKGNFIKADLLNLPLRDNSISFIYSCMSLEYVKDTQKAIDESFRVLKKKGRMIAIIPVVSLTTLTYHQLRGDIPGLPILRNVMELFHVKIFKGKYLHYGYEQSFTIKKIKKMYIKAGFKVVKVDYFDMYYPIEFVPSVIRPFFKKILKYRFFWPLAYIEAVKN